ncbi:hypothetical protein KP509_16G033400 [Ceratopteris richardii]|uniref:IRK-interacting protein n=1 Tax=Ceratopteris richardii TaxID=49495 RepID=A0A8T2SXS7_CERRI|nr:hypothetical protein KP509_16G033400 [Ceratopteris richardii]KAH7387627.1 hypothetical protein KP509_16G033400 [Ceratopteris richardii]
MIASRQTITMKQKLKSMYTSAQIEIDSCSVKSVGSIGNLTDEGDDWLSPFMLEDASLPHALDLQIHSGERSVALGSRQHPSPYTSTATILGRKPEISEFHLMSMEASRISEFTTNAPSDKQKSRRRSDGHSHIFSSTNGEDVQEGRKQRPLGSKHSTLAQFANLMPKPKTIKFSGANRTSTHEFPGINDSHSATDQQIDVLNFVSEQTKEESAGFSRDCSASVASSSDNIHAQSYDKLIPGGRMTVFPINDSLDFEYLSVEEENARSADVKRVPTSRKQKSVMNKVLLSWLRPKRKAGDSPGPTSQKGSRNYASRGLTVKNDLIDECTFPEKIKANTEAVKEKLMHLERGKEFLETVMNKMKEEVSQANEKRDAALVEVFELRAAMEVMQKKVEGLTSYCETHMQNSKRNNTARTTAARNLYQDQDSGFTSIAMGGEQEHYNQMVGGALTAAKNSDSFLEPSRKEFLHAVTESRIAVKQFCKIFVYQTQMERITSDIEKILDSYSQEEPKSSKYVRYQLEALINDALYEGFENVKFQNAGTMCILNQHKRRQAFYNAYSATSQMAWSELVDKESDSYCHVFDTFCDKKMNKIEEVLNWEGSWPDELARSFFIAAKWIWLLHLLAFSFQYPALIFRVGCDALFDSQFMEDISVYNWQPSKSKRTPFLPSAEPFEPASIRIRKMVMPGFLFNDEDIIKCKVIVSTERSLPSIA